MAPSDGSFMWSAVILDLAHQELLVDAGQICNLLLAPRSKTLWHFAKAPSIEIDQKANRNYYRMILTSTIMRGKHRPL